ncbi:MAG: DUF1318 domain-containing protein [Bacteriovoracia bacterium]
MNVNFPESAVQRAADDFVRDIYTNPPSDSKPDTKEEVKPENQDQGFFQVILLNQAFAQQVRTDSVKAKKIKARMHARVPQIVKFKKDGLLGETLDGNLVLKDPRKAGTKLKSVRALVDEENTDRDQLYAEVAEVNSITDRNQARIRKIFASAFRKNSPAGTWIQQEDESWIQVKK